MNIFQILRDRKHALAEQRRREAVKNLLAKLSAESRHWMAASGALDLEHFLTLSRFYIEGHPKATGEMIHDYANKLSRLADALQRETAQ